VKLVGGKCWLITWTTYGSWLPGDPRGFQTRDARQYVPPPARYAPPGAVAYRPAPYRGLHRYAQALTEDVVRLSWPECQTALEAMVEEVRELALLPRAMSVAPTHVHFLGRFGSLLIKATVGRLKSAATRRLEGFSAERHAWCRDCHIKSIVGEQAVQKAVEYIRRHVEEDGVVHVWEHPEGVW
jgi:hypothetical protein